MPDHLRHTLASASLGQLLLAHSVCQIKASGGCADLAEAVELLASRRHARKSLLTALLPIPITGLFHDDGTLGTMSDADLVELLSSRREVSGPELQWTPNMRRHAMRLLRSVVNRSKLGRQRPKGSRWRIYRQTNEKDGFIDAETNEWWYKDARHGPVRFVRWPTLLRGRLPDVLQVPYIAPELGVRVDYGPFLRSASRIGTYDLRLVAALRKDPSIASKVQLTDDSCDEGPHGVCRPAVPHGAAARGGSSPNRSRRGHLHGHGSRPALEEDSAADRRRPRPPCPRISAAAAQSLLRVDNPAAITADLLQRLRFELASSRGGFRDTFAHLHVAEEEEGAAR